MLSLLTPNFEILLPVTAPSVVDAPTKPIISISNDSLITYQVDQTPHSILLSADALARIKPSLCHFSPDRVVYLPTKQSRKHMNK